MAPLIVLLTVFSLTSLAAYLGLGKRGDWVTRLRLALAAMFLLTASAHWGSMRPDLVRMVPTAFPNPELLVTITGIAEILGAIGLLVPRLAPYAATGLVLLMLAVFPANVRAAREGLTIGGAPVWGVAARGLLQLFFIACTLAAGFGRQLLARGTARHGAVPGPGPLACG